MLAGVLLGVFFVAPLVALYVLFIRWCDRFEPEPWWLLLCAFFFGALVATAGGGTMNGLSQTLASLTLGQPADSEDVQAIVATLSAPIFEELFKGLGVGMIAVISWLGVKELDGPLDGAIYGGVVGLGFTLTEDVEYVSNAFASSGFGGFLGIWFIRTVLNGLTHCTFTAMTGLGFGLAVESAGTASRSGCTRSTTASSSSARRGSSSCRPSTGASTSSSSSCSGCWSRETAPSSSAS
jgi:RsiW-degrading membrane proteinase PrsW (M82 family)